jgi:hypothetical protein
MKARMLMVSHNLQCSTEVATRSLLLKKLLELIFMHGTITGENNFCEVERLLQKYKQPLNELFVLTTDGAPELSGCKNCVLGKLNVKVNRMIPNFKSTFILIKVMMF